MDNRLLSAALLGTARQPFQPTATEDGLGDVLKGLAGEKPEEALLGAAASYFLYEKAGTNPPTATEPLPEVAPTDTLRPCNRRSAQHLNKLLDGKHWDILQEWLEAAAYYGKHAPAEKLPKLLNLADSQPELLAAIGPVLGERGRWLAAQNPKWIMQAGLDLEAARETWESGTKAQRVTFLKKLRQMDPAQARELLQEAWRGEGAEQRRDLLNTFAVNLSPADEPFLEEKLDDRSQEVRFAASDLLILLPNSALVGRMIERANRVISYDPRRKPLFNFGAKKKSPVEVTPYETVDDAMLRDGINPQSEVNSMGDKAWVMHQIIAAIPPGYWLNHWQVNPNALLREAIDSEWADILVGGWRAALNRHHDSVWAEAFTRYWLSHRETSKLRNNSRPNINSLTYPQFEELVLEAFRKDANPIHDGHAAFEMVSIFKGGEWRPELIRAIIKSLRRRIAAQNANTYHWRIRRELLKILARHTPPSMLDELAQGWPEDLPDWTNWAREVKEYLGLVELRKEMLKEISQ